LAGSLGTHWLPGGHGDGRFRARPFFRSLSDLWAAPILPVGISLEKGGGDPPCRRGESHPVKETRESNHFACTDVIRGGHQHHPRVQPSSPGPPSSEGRALGGRDMGPWTMGAVTYAPPGDEANPWGAPSSGWPSGPGHGPRGSSPGGGVSDRKRAWGGCWTLHRWGILCGLIPGQHNAL